MKAFQVLKPGMLTTVQDAGRYCHLRYGVPISGAMDAFSFVAANLLVGNDRNDACLEMTLICPELRALADTQIAVTGGNCQPRVNSESVPMWQTLNLQKNDRVSFGKMTSGCRAYISMRGGIDTPMLLGSRSTYVRGGFGGLDGRQLRMGDLIEGFSVTPIEARYFIPSEMVPQFSDHFKINVVLGPQAEMFTEKGIEAFLSNSYRITSEADRMGYRLEGPTIEHVAKADIVSDALMPGAVQIPGNGKPMVIMRDAQTTGGYTKIAVAITSDVALLGQAKPDDLVEFSEVTIRQAHEKACEYFKTIDSLNLLLKKQ